MMNIDYEAWRCRYDDTLFCPDESCPKCSSALAANLFCMAAPERVTGIRASHHRQNALGARRRRPMVDEPRLRLRLAS